MNLAYTIQVTIQWTLYIERTKIKLYVKLRILFDAFLEEQEWRCVCEAGKHCPLLVRSRHSIDYYYLDWSLIS